MVRFAVRNHCSYVLGTYDYLHLAAVSITAIVLQTQNLLCPESMSLAFGNSWIQIVKVISVTLATYFLIEFYYVIRKDIAYDLPCLGANIKSIQTTYEIFVHQVCDLSYFLSAT